MEHFYNSCSDNSYLCACFWALFPDYFSPMVLSYIFLFFLFFVIVYWVPDILNFMLFDVIIHCIVKILLDFALILFKVLHLKAFP